MQSLASLALLFSVLVPGKIWVPAGQPLNVTVQADGAFVLYVTDFAGKVLEKGSAEVQGNQAVDLLTLFPALKTPSTYVIFAVPKAKTEPPDGGTTAPPFYTQFVGTPLVIGVRADRRLAGAAETLVTKIEPLRYATIETDQGTMTATFYYDAAPHTVATLLSLMGQGFYDGLTFHRIVPGFVVQGGDPRGDGRGGPGFSLNAEFSDRKHVPGVLSMARQGDPLEAQGLKPRSEFANTAGSQFFICLEAREHFDGRYTAFGEIAHGEEVYKALANTPLADQRAGKPVNAPVIRKIQSHLVTAQNNPYVKTMPDLKAQRSAPNPLEKQAENAQPTQDPKDKP